ncbi:STAS domain-containing protein [Deefgea rivuli]|uniref:STAS domain-containing protein n=1 Tax=Deefgea rivuli TaxID=400948 RepID=UPI000560B3FA|nr:STAS domain-containing protein [Deefgea rivuli]
MNEIILARELTFANSPAALSLLDGALAQTELSINCAALEIVDSSAVAVLLEWQRRAKAAGCQLRFMHLPSNLQQLIAVYGLSALLGTADATT